jgi:hypothetical protein
MNRWIFTALAATFAAAAQAQQEPVPAATQPQASASSLQQLGAQLRTMPREGLAPGIIAVSNTPPSITVDGRADRFSPGARIRDTNNMMVLSQALAGRTIYAVYKRDGVGLVHEVWMLTAEEYAKVGGTSDIGNPEGYKRFQELLDIIWAARWLLIR